jgi:hypothetical protein
MVHSYINSLYHDPISHQLIPTIDFTISSLEEQFYYGYRYNIELTRHTLTFFNSIPNILLFFGVSIL